MELLLGINMAVVAVAAFGSLIYEIVTGGKNAR